MLIFFINTIRPSDSDRQIMPAGLRKEDIIMKKIVNLTPHAINIIGQEGQAVATFASEGLARATQTQVVVGEVNGIELVKMSFGKTEELPAPEEGTYLVVSIITANAAKAEGRTIDDLLITADPVRDGEGKIIGCKRFAVI